MPEANFSIFKTHRETNPEVECGTVMPNNLNDPELENNDLVAGEKRKFHPGHFDIPKRRQNMHHDCKQIQRPPWVVILSPPLLDSGLTNTTGIIHCIYIRICGMK